MADQRGVGVVGLGIMGLAFAMNLKKAGMLAAVYNRSEAGRKKAVESGLDCLVDTASRVTETADVIIVMVTDGNAARQVLSGPNGVLTGDARGKTVIQMSTIDPETTLELAKAVDEKGAVFLDCPVAGSKPAAEAGQVIVLAGGDPAEIAKVSPVLAAIGKNIVHAGPVGMGTALKLCVNLLVAQMTTALCESVVLAETQHLEPAKVFEVVRLSPALNCGYFQAKEGPLLRGDFRPAFSLRNVLKDVRFMEETASRHGKELPVTTAVRSLMEEADRDEYGDDDLVGLVRTVRNRRKTPKG